MILDVERSGSPTDGPIELVKFGRFINAVDRDGSHQTEMLHGEGLDRYRSTRVRLVDGLRGDPDHLLVSTPNTDGGVKVWKVDVHSGQGNVVENGDSNIVGWDTDEDGHVVVRFRRDSTSISIEGRAVGETKWTRIVRLAHKDLLGLSEFEILGPTDKSGEFYVAVKPKTPEDGDFRTLRTYDLRSKTLSAPVWPELKHDIENIVYAGASYRLAGVCYTDDIYRCDFKDPSVNAYFRGLSKYFGGVRNITPISTSNDTRWWLFEVSGAEEPASYYLLDWQAKDIKLLAQRFPKLPGARLASMTRFSYLARDGVQIPSYLTRPPQGPGLPPIAGPLPMIVLPHGGPEARDSLAYDSWVQYLATRGYLVFQPNFRGSRGYGKSWSDAGAKQWNGRMADDVTDGVRALIAQRVADPARICIFGASYGGYAALVAGATHPELYKCVASWAGLSDLAQQLRREKAVDDEEDEVYKYWAKSIGDPKIDAAAIKAASPVTYATTYGPPVLLIHGEDDDIVRIEQSKIMEKALREAGKSVRLIAVRNEGHPHFDNKDKEISALIELGNFITTYISPYADMTASQSKTAEAPSKSEGVSK